MSYSLTALASAVLCTVAIRTNAEDSQPPGSSPDLVKQAEKVDRLEKEIRNLQSDVNRLRSKNSELERAQRSLAEDSGDVAVIVLMFGIFCALWAQNSGRNAWLWFFLGLFFNIITALVLLSKNAEDRRSRHRNSLTPSE